jgi:hypothetical protein
MADPSLWSHEYTSGQSSTDFAFPSDAQWIQAVGPGTIVLAMAGGVTFTRHCVGGEVYPGRFLSLTSTSCTYLVVGNAGVIPPAIAPGVNAATAAVAGSSIMSVAPAVAASPIAVGTNDPRVCTVEIALPLVLASGIMAESTVWIPGVVATILSATLSHNANVTQSDTDYLTYTLGIRDGAGGAASTVASKTTKTTGGGAFLAFQALTLGSIGNATTTATSQITFKSVIGGAGQAVTGPAMLRITYSVP